MIEQKPKRKRTGEQLRKLGFDLTTYDRSTGYYHVKCSCCQALVINGLACHEIGCSNSKT